MPCAQRESDVTDQLDAAIEAMDVFACRAEHIRLILSIVQELRDELAQAGQPVSIECYGEGLAQRFLIAIDPADMVTDVPLPEKAWEAARLKAVDEIAASEVLAAVFDDAGIPVDQVFADDAPLAVDDDGFETIAQDDLAPVAVPAPEPALVAVETPPGPIIVPDPVDRYAGLIPAATPLSDTDRATLLRMHDAGAQSGEIAAKLGRDPRGVYHTVKREFLAREEQAKAAQNDTAPPLGALSSADRKLDQRLNTLGFAGKWSDPADSLALVEGLGKGVKLAQIALDLGIDAQVCRFRFDDLVPHKSIEEQAAVLAALRRRVAARQAAAA
jgi:hypothetical protein